LGVISPEGAVDILIDAGGHGQGLLHGVRQDHPAGAEVVIFVVGVAQIHNGDAFAAGVDHLFQKNPNYMLAMEEGPYYATKVVTRYLTSLGGLKINENMQVLDTNEKAIKGLYAAGVDAAGVLYGDAYVDVDGAGFGWAFSSGRMAAMEAAATLAE